MRTRWMPCLVVIMVVASASAATAQPPETIKPEYAPNRVIDFLAMAYNGYEIHNLTEFVAGGKAGAARLVELNRELLKHKQNGLQVYYEAGHTTIDHEQATVSFQLDYRHHDTILTESIVTRYTVDETVQLRLKWQDGKPSWQVVPGNPDKVLDDPKAGPILKLATYIAFPDRMLTLAYSHMAYRKLKQLALSAMALIQDYDKLPEPAKFDKLIASYLRSDDDLVAPGTKEGQKFQFNRRLCGTAADELPDKEHTVLWYEGADEKLDYRYNGQAAVAFLDGHVKLVTPDDAKSLRWEPGKVEAGNRTGGGPPGAPAPQ